MYSKDSVFTYKVEDNTDFIIEEKNNSFIALRKVSFADKPAKWDLRKWFTDNEGKEVMGKGVSFFTEDGPDILTKTLVENGFGNTLDVLNGVKNRGDFRSSLNVVVGKDDELYDKSAKGTDYFDPAELLNMAEQKLQDEDEE